MIRTNFIVARSSMLLRTAVFRRIPFQEIAAGIQRAGAFLGAAAVEPVVVGEGVALVTCVMVLVCNRGVREGL